MQTATSNRPQPAARHRPKSLTVFAAAFIAGAAAAVGVNRVLDIQLAQSRPQVESEPIFVALRSLPQGSPVTVWDVALRDWPKAMLPASALRAEDSFEGMVLRHPLREGQPLLAVQLVRSEASGLSPATGDSATLFEPPFTAPAARPASAATQTDLWTPAEAVSQAAPAPVPSQPTTVAAADQPPVSAPSQTSSDIAPPPAAPSAAASPLDVVAVPAADAESAAQPAMEQVAATDVAAESPVTEREIGEPTLADPLPVEPTAAAEAPLESIVAMPTEALTAPLVEPTQADPVAEVADEGSPDVKPLPTVAEAKASESQQQRDSVMRYLVVPERIAMQADASFVSPPVAPPQPRVAPVPVDAPTAPRASPAAAPSSPQPKNSGRHRGRRQATCSRTAAAAAAVGPVAAAAIRSVRQPAARARAAGEGVWGDVSEHRGRYRCDDGWHAEAASRRAAV